MLDRMKKAVAIASSAALAASGMVIAQSLPCPEAQANAAGYPEAVSFDDVSDASPASSVPATSSFSGTISQDDLSFQLELDSDEAARIAALPEDEQAGALAETLSDDPIYEVSFDGATVTVEKPYALKRIVVDASVGDIDDMGAESAVYDAYTATYVLTYKTMEDTADAFTGLIDQAGEGNVMLDVPVHALGASSSFDGWGIAEMNLDEAEDALDASDAAKVKVAVIDTGADAAHPAFADVDFDSASGSFLSARGASRTSTSFADDNGHGTHVTNIITSATPDSVSLLELKGLDANGSGSLYDIFYALTYAANNGADVVSLSLGANLGTGRGVKSTKNMFDKAIKKVSDRGGAVFAASSNDGADMDAAGTYPATSPYAYAVGALDASGSRAYYSNYGQSLDFVAPGSSISSAWPGGGTRKCSGTSMATPHASAFMADLMALYPDKDASGLSEMMKAMSKDLGDAGFDVYYGYGEPVFDMSLFADDEPDGAQSSDDGQGEAGGVPQEGQAPDAAQPAEEPASDQPASETPAGEQPTSEQPSAEQPTGDQPSTGQPADPAPAQPEEPEAGQPAEPEPSQPEQPAPAQPEIPAEPAPSQSAPEQPAQPEPSQPAEPAPAEPAPAEPAPAEPEQPATEQPAEAEQPAAEQPTSEQPAEPESPAPAPEDGQQEEPSESGPASEPAPAQPETPAPAIKRTNILNGNFFVSGLNSSYSYTGSPIEPRFSLYEKNGPWHYRELVLDRDYTVEFSDNVEVGYARAKITGIGRYEGSANVYFRIDAPRQQWPKYWPWR